MHNTQWDRLAVITEFVVKAGEKGLGRTALMKCLYFLEALRGVWLGYDFRLYTYGPFDTAVLDDLGYAESLSAIVSEVKSQTKGYAYTLKGGHGANSIMARGSNSLEKYQNDIDWVFQKFAHRSASELELISTIVFIDRETYFSNCKATFKEISSSVHDIKPHFTLTAIISEAKNLDECGWLRSVK